MFEKTGFLNAGGRLVDLSSPLVMGIVNATPDSFYAASRHQSEAAIAARAEEMASQGADIIDVGACSTRPGAVFPTEEEEAGRLRMALDVVRRTLPGMLLSVDTFRPRVARMAVEECGAHIVNDVSGGTGHMADGLTPQGIGDQPDHSEMFATVARLRVPYILMSSKSNIADMLLHFARCVEQLRALGQKDIVLDPGFGFGKSLEQNFSVLNQMERLHVFGLPVLVGLSRKSMIWKALNTTPQDALTGTTVLNTLALMKGAAILRVHDVKEARQAVEMVKKVKSEE